MSRMHFSGTFVRIAFAAVLSLVALGFGAKSTLADVNGYGDNYSSGYQVPSYSDMHYVWSSTLQTNIVKGEFYSTTNAPHGSVQWLNAGGALFWTPDGDWSNAQYQWTYDVGSGNTNFMTTSFSVSYTHLTLPTT